jgi:hypothetical protein
MTRPRRLHVRQLCSTPVELRDVWTTYATVMLNVSQGGARLESLVEVQPGAPRQRTPQPGDRVTVVVNAPRGPIALKAEVVWTRETSVLGLRWDPPLEPAELDTLLGRPAR